MRSNRDVARAAKCRAVGLFASVLTFLALAAAAAAGNGGADRTAGATCRPNVLLLISDDQAWSDFGFMGHEVIETPRLDALVHNAGGLTADYPMAEAFNYARWCRQADGPDQVHMMALGKQLIRKFAG